MLACRRFIHRHGFLSHLRSLKGYDEPEILPSSTHPICLMSADGGQSHIDRGRLANPISVKISQWHDLATEGPAVLRRHSGRLPRLPHTVRRHSRLLHCDYPTRKAEFASSIVCGRDGGLWLPKTLSI